MALLLSEADVRAVLTMPLAIEAVEESFRRLAEGTIVLHMRQHLNLPEKAFLHYMAAADRISGYMGIKIYTAVGGTLRFVVLLYSIRTGELLAVIEANYLGQVRTGAASGVATRHMARADARTVGIIGTGLQARTQLEAVAAVRQLESIRAYSRDAARREQFAREMSDLLGVPIEAVESGEAAVRDADVVIAATSASKPVVLGAWLAPGCHINAIGANFPHKRELDDDAVARAGLIVADSREQSRLEAGDLIRALGDDQGRWSVVRELCEVVAGSVAGRTNPRQITLFKSNGIAMEDVAAGARAYELARQQGLGREITLWSHA
jgi:ornithine cyclodeaminase/alanine dehydrogenase-like protein (mu-crystallin family)